MNRKDQFPLTFSKLKNKKVVNTPDGAILGQVADLELDADLQSIRAILLPIYGGFLGSQIHEYSRIPLECIESIGKDLILVKIAKSDSKRK